MDETTLRKIRDLKLKIMLTEKELHATQHTLSLGSWLRAGHAGQIQRTAERDRQRLEARLSELREKLAALTPAEELTAEPEKPEPAPPEAAPAPKKKASAKKATAATSAPKRKKA